ncbi:MAG: NADH-quinone oxidoreductase subunit J [Deltaproteobacteria bacterium]|nr:MAG: NADH-quinone oxidoreductase subunit J [Deltaproteobacteria bacterium]
MTGDQFLFLILAALSTVSSLLVIFQRNIVRSAMALVATLFLVAVLFLTLDAPMVGFLQILVYAGAIMVLFLFVIMLLNSALLEQRQNFWWGFGSLTALLLVIEILFLVSKSFELDGRSPSLSGSFGSPELLAQTLFTDFVLPFEIASLLLLVAIIGAVVLAKRGA